MDRKTDAYLLTLSAAATAVLLGAFLLAALASATR